MMIQTQNENLLIKTLQEIISKKRPLNKKLNAKNTTEEEK